MMKKKLLGVILVLLVLGVGGYMYLYQEHRDIKNETPVAILSARDLQNKFSTNYDKSVSDFLNKTVEIKGMITESTDSTLVVDNLVFCSLLKDSYKTDLNGVVTIKGRCLGYDELFEQVKLDQCSIK